MTVQTPQKCLGLAPLLRFNLAGEELAPLCQLLIQRATENPDDAASLLDAGIVFQFHGDPVMAQNLQQEALKLCRHYWIPAARPARLRLLALVAPGELMGNVPIECLLEDSDIELHLLFVTDAALDPADIPEHDVLFVAIGDSERNRQILAEWQARLAHWPKPVLNGPPAAERVKRDTAARLLADLPGVAMPPTLRVDRPSLQRLADGEAPEAVFPPGIRFPLLLRPFDSQAGRDLYKIETPAELADILGKLSGDGFYLSSFIDYSSADGQFRKFRVILVDGRPYACHMGISDHWMIHYLNAGMANSPTKRAEEAQFMADFDSGFAVRHGEALAAIHRAIGLDYLGIDCAETQDGRLLVFEVDPAMVVHAMDPVDVYPYKPANMQKIFAAFRAMLIERAERHAATV